MKIIFFILLLGAAANGADWPQFLGPSRNGIAGESNLLARWPSEGPRQLWSLKVGQGFSGPVIAQGKLILFHRVGDQEAVECLNATNGASLWKFNHPTAYRDDFGSDEGPRATPTIAADKVFTVGAEATVHCVDLGTGKKVWEVNAKETLQARKGFFGFACSPLVEGSNVIVNIGGPEAGIVAFDAATGRVRWKVTDHEASYSAAVAATLDGKRLALVFTRNGLVGLNPAGGEVFFEFPFRSASHASVNAATPLVIGKKIFLSASYETGAILLDYKTNGVKAVWSSDDAISAHYATPVHRDGFLYGFHGRQERRPALRCVELNTGKVRWNHEGLGAGTVTLVGDTLLVMSEKGELLSVQATPQQFKIVARAQILPYEVRAAPGVANGLFYARSKEKLVCVDLRPRN